MKPQRDKLIDILRLSAIVLMIFAHTNMILGTSGFFLNEWGKNLGNFICFALFLFCFGAANYYGFESHKVKSVYKLLKRIGVIYIAYIIISAVLIIDSKNLSIYRFIDLLIFNSLPSYGEFLATFIIFEILYFLAPEIFNRFASKIWIIILVSTIAFLLANILKDFNYGILSNYTALLWGKDGYYSFPIMQYISIFLLGIYYSKNKENLNFKKLSISTLILFTFYFLLFTFYFPQLRWPPNLTYVTGNLAALYLFIAMAFVANRARWTNNNVSSRILGVNKRVVHILYTHVIILYLLRWTGFTYSPIYAYIVTLGIIGIFVILNKYRFRINNEN